MFGSKIRSWMENHIVRPRKKGNKSKNISNNTTPPESDIFQKELNGYRPTASEFNIYPDDAAVKNVFGTALHVINSQNVGSNSVQSPVRRREVSPIESHTTSRFGWQSPHKEETFSSKSDHLGYTQNKGMKENSFAASFQGYGNQNVQQKHVKQKAPCVLTAIPHRTSLSAPSLSVSVGSNKNQRHENSSKNLNSLKRASNASEMQNMPIVDSATTSDPKVELINTLIMGSHYKRKDEKYDYERNRYGDVIENASDNSNRNHQRHNMNKSQKLHDYNKPRIECSPEKTVRYGKIMPSKFKPDDYKCSLSNRNIMATMENDNISHSNSHRINCNNVLIQGPASVKTVSVYHDAHQKKVATVAAAGCSNRNILRTSRYSGVITAATASNGNATIGAPAHIINSLSSPESAYSTGYSTDGTSPSGATCTPPEYYVNIRTGTHYFPKSINTLAIEAQRYKFGLNKIEEMSPQDPMPFNSPLISSIGTHRRTESFDCGNNKICDYGINQAEVFRNRFANAKKPDDDNTNNNSIYKNVVISTVNGFESPSPRQRCRIRTNPWYSTNDASSAGPNVSSNPKQNSGQNASAQSNIVEIDANSSSSSGVKTSSESWLDNNNKSEKLSEESSGGTSSSSTEIEDIHRSFSANTIKRKKSELLRRPAETEVICCKSTSYSNYNHCSDLAVSDEDITLNEMLGKFDESYIYEKETDILSSDSDRTDYLSDLDTGQDAGDECDTDDMLDIDFIDTTSVHEVGVDRNKEKAHNTTKVWLNANNGPEYAVQHSIEPHTLQINRMFYNPKNLIDLKEYSIGNCLQRKRKRLMKTRKKSNELRGYTSPIRSCRESRSLGGTPMCLRRHHLPCNKSPALSYRSSSLTFTELHAIREHFVQISESEKALLRADLEADVKYRQLIHEAETILVSMKTSALSISNDTTIDSPRRICNPLANKRVEMLKNYELDVKRDHFKQDQRYSDPGDFENIEISKCELSAETAVGHKKPFPSPCRMPFGQNVGGPSRGDFTNIQIVRKQDSSPERSQAVLRKSQNLSKDPTMKVPTHVHRRTQSQSHKQYICSDTDSDDKNNSNGNEKATKPTTSIHQVKKLRNYLAQPRRTISQHTKSIYANSSVEKFAAKSSILAFKSMPESANSYCPQSEPLKRKIYNGSSSFERIKKNFQFDSEAITKQSSLENDSHATRLERRKSSAMKNKIAQSFGSTMNDNIDKLMSDEGTGTSSSLSMKQQLILNTIEDLKKNLVNQSVELSGLNSTEQT